tara:strand:- start:8873 stop:9814 length:942 start_codon:yes stop_codon:yes gene_type:complete
MCDSKSPWVEKYRPIHFDDIVLDSINKKILNNIIKTKKLPNLLLYGPPGTGKTTTIINLVNKYHNDNAAKKCLTIHLNASDERGIDIIRNQINCFVNSKTLFVTGTKLVILDEVDYMTKNAQQALKYLLRSINNNVRFCLICNYITRIDESLQNEFMRLRFNQLPKNDIISFLKKITINEKLNFSNETLVSIQELYKSDIRSMINYIQANKHICLTKKAINYSIWETFTEMMTCDCDIELSIQYIDDICSNYNIEEKHFIKDYFNYIIRYKSHYINKDFLCFIEFTIHISSNNNNFLKYYFVHRLQHFFLSQK